MTVIEGYFHHLAATTVHKLWVLLYLVKFSIRLILRGLKHDMSKYSFAESRHFAKEIGILRHVEYRSDEYKECMQRLQPSLEHHYKNNSHHPEYHYMKLSGMNLLDVVEMFYDWQAATKRNKNGNLMKSVEMNQQRFGIPKELSSIFINSI